MSSHAFIREPDIRICTVTQHMLTTLLALAEAALDVASKAAEASSRVPFKTRACDKSRASRTPRACRRKPERLQRDRLLYSTALVRCLAAVS